jgi:prophage antirepressor-like protein
MKQNSLQVFQFESNEVRAFMKDSEIWWVAKDVCEVLGLVNITEALKALDPDELTSTMLKSGGQNREMKIINEPGLYSLILRSRKPQAKTFKRWVTHEVLPTIRKTGSFDTPSATANKSDSKDELSRRRLEVMEKNANWRTAKLLLDMVNKYEEKMSDDSISVFLIKSGEALTGADLSHCLPKITKKWYSATDLGKEFNVSKNMIGRISNSHGLKPPEGETNEYGEWIRSKASNNPSERPTFMYYDTAREWFRAYFAEQEKAQ